MTTSSSPGAFRTIFFGGLVVGALDLLDALTFFGLRGAKLIRIPQSIAAGLLGKASFQGGLHTAALGVGLHFLVAFTIVATFYLASGWMTILTRRFVTCGVLYGLVVYVAMNFVVIPLSAASAPAFRWPILINGLLIHMFGVGLPSALFARAARRGK